MKLISCIMNEGYECPASSRRTKIQRWRQFRIQKTVENGRGGIYTNRWSGFVDRNHSGWPTAKSEDHTSGTDVITCLYFDTMEELLSGHFHQRASSACLEPVLDLAMVLCFPTP